MTLKIILVTTNINVICCLWCVDQRVGKPHFTIITPRHHNTVFKHLPNTKIRRWISLSVNIIVMNIPRVFFFRSFLFIRISKKRDVLTYFPSSSPRNSGNNRDAFPRVTYDRGAFPRVTMGTNLTVLFWWHHQHPNSFAVMTSFPGQVVTNPSILVSF